MPAPARISVPVKQATPIKPASTITPKTPASMPRPKTRVVHRRRARGRLDDTDTDEELVREPRSDDDSDSASSTLDSESETVSDSDPDPDPEEQEVASVPSPSHAPLANGTAPGPSPSPRLAEKHASFPQSINWSEMVAEENANGTADLPVIDFADLSSHTQDPPEAPAPVPSPPIVTQGGRPHDASPSQVSRRKPGQSARQAYRTRLDTDPAYVPTLGQFWSHDDRLLDKDLRSLSGWWRGRWQGRGRGRGFGAGWGNRGARGRGGFGNSAGPFPVGESQIRPPEEPPRAERAWTHDGFEEMKKVDEVRNHDTFRGRGTFPRGRGGFRGGFPGRSGFTAGSSVSAGAPSESQHSSTSDILCFGTGTRPWFTTKPERVWTKQFDAYLYFEAPLKPVHNQGLGQGVRIRLPGGKGGDGGGIVVRLPLRMADPPQQVLVTKEPLGERGFVVKLPRGKVMTKENNRMNTLLPPEDVITVAPPPMEDSVPVLPPLPIRPTETRPSKDTPTFVPARPPARRVSDAMAPTAQALMGIQAEMTPEYEPPLTSDDVAAAGPSHLALRIPQEANQPIENMQQPPLQTTAPPFQPSPPYGSPFGYAQPGLPPGIAVSESGMAYEIATGRAVFLHTPPPPPPPLQMQGTLYNPRPVPMHHAHQGSVHFLPPPPPHHASISPPGFLASPPIFALPRQNSRVEIRAPAEKGKEREQTERVRPAVRSAVNINAEPFTPAAQAPPIGFYGPEAHAGFDETQRHHHLYQHAPYYYPLGHEGAAPYGYAQYTPSDAGQPQHYEQYTQEAYPQQQQHTGYY